MIRFGTPKDTSKYFKVSKESSVYLLQKNGFEPVYRDDDFIYLIAKEELISSLMNKCRREEDMEFE